MSKSLEIVKNWNAIKKTRLPFTSGENDSAIVRKIDLLMNNLGENEVCSYYGAMLDDETITDIWSISDEIRISRWINNNKTTAKVEEVKPVENGASMLGLLSKEIVSLMGTELANKINAEVEKKISTFIQDKTLVKVVEYKDEHKKVDGVVHEKFDTILKFVAMDEPVLLTGPAGTGKNVIAKQVAEALGLDFYFSNAVTQEYKITGYGDANGEYVKTQFFDAFTKGGLFLLDEMDASCPEALIVLNCAIANRYFDFPVIGRVEAHPNFRVMANANTFGTGATMEYVGRNQLDGATLNRFAVVEVDYDKRIEDNVCPDKDIADFCRAFRKVCNKNGVHHIVSYREMSRLYKMITIAGLDKAVALKTCLTKGLEGDTLKMIWNDMPNIAYREELKKIM